MCQKWRDTKWKWTRKPKLWMPSPDRAVTNERKSLRILALHPAPPGEHPFPCWQFPFTPYWLISPLPLRIPHSFCLFHLKILVLKNHKGNTFSLQSVWYNMKIAIEKLRTVHPIPNLFCICSPTTSSMHISMYSWVLLPFLFLSKKWDLNEHMNHLTYFSHWFIYQEKTTQVNKCKSNSFTLSIVV